MKMKMKETCPFCKSTKNKILKNWKYSGTQVKRLECECGKLFNFYQSKKSSWTIPKKSS